MSEQPGEGTSTGLPQQDERHLDLLSTFHYVAAGLTAALSCLVLPHLVIGFLMLTQDLNGQAEEIPAIFPLMFILMPGAMFVGAWVLAGLMVATALKLKRRESHTFCLVVAGVECMMMPYGTVLGIFTIIVLSRDSVTRLFDARRVPPASPGSGAE